MGTESHTVSHREHSGHGDVVLCVDECRQRFLLRITMRCMVETQYDAACCGSTASLQVHTSYFTSYFMLHASYFLMVETQYDAACCGSTASLQVHTSYFVSPCVAWWRRSTTQRAAARLRLYNFPLPTSYFVSPCVAWWSRSTTQRAAARLRLYNFPLPTSYFLLPTS